jgi:hypothetical protein
VRGPRRYRFANLTEKLILKQSKGWARLKGPAPRRPAALDHGRAPGGAGDRGAHHVTAPHAVGVRRVTCVSTKVDGLARPPPARSARPWSSARGRRATAYVCVCVCVRVRAAACATRTLRRALRARCTYVACAACATMVRAPLEHAAARVTVGHARRARRVRGVPRTARTRRPALTARAGRAGRAPHAPRAPCAAWASCACARRGVTLCHTGAHAACGP